MRDVVTPVDNLYSLRRAPGASSNPSTTDSKESPDDVHNSFHVIAQVQWEVCAAVRAVYSAAHDNRFTATQLIHGVKCDACKTFPTSQVMISTSVFTYLRKYGSAEQSHIYPSQRMVETVGT